MTTFNPNERDISVDEDGSITVSAVPGTEVCDFCADLHPVWSYPCADLMFDEANGSLGNWAACQACSELIELDDYKALGQRTVDEWFRINDLESQRPKLEAGAARQTANTQHLFRIHRNGDRVAWKTPEEGTTDE